MIANLRRFLAVVPAVTMALIHAGTCPACWPLFGGLLFSLDLTFLVETRHLLPLMIGCLAIAIAALSYGARLPAAAHGACGICRHFDREIRPRCNPGHGRRCCHPCWRISLEFLAQPGRSFVLPKLLCAHRSSRPRQEHCAREGDGHGYSHCMYSQSGPVRRTQRTGETTRAGSERTAGIAARRRLLFRAGFQPSDRACETRGPRTSLLPLSHI
jgi:hypothetical protein